MKDADVVGQVRAKREYTKPSQIKRVQKQEAIRKLAWEVKKEKEALKNHIWTTIVNGKAV